MTGDHRLVTADELEKLGVLRKGTAFRMSKAGIIPSYQCGVKGRGIRFRVEEVLAALRRPAKSEEQTS
ncbi:MAG: hypothetical protein FJY85_13670 [Deltaproteobacteria bacterium]|nr:hypothetical protein [Deltaproteobacteria bacterium]MBM4138182.1 hypothetical protein [Nitrospira sp.]